MAALGGATSSRIPRPYISFKLYAFLGGTFIGIENCQKYTI